MSSVSENLKKRREQVDDEGLVAVVDEALENQGSIAREVDEPTLKHGTDTVNYSDIVSEGLVPGDKNVSNTGESGRGQDVALSGSFPVALRYAELTEASDYNPDPLEATGAFEIPDDFGAVNSPMVVEIPASDLDQASIHSKNGVREEVLGREMNNIQASMLLDYITDDDPEDLPWSYESGAVPQRVLEGERKAQELFKSVVGSEYGDTSVLMENDVFDMVDHDEVNGEFLQEVNTPYAPVTGETTVYVPRDEVQEYREKASELGFEGDVHSIEARALVHEERMREVYGSQGTVNFTHPADTEGPVNMYDTDGKQQYRGSPDVIDISRLRGEPVYRNGSNI